MDYIQTERKGSQTPAKLPLVNAGFELKFSCLILLGAVSIKKHMCEQQAPRYQVFHPSGHAPFPSHLYADQNILKILIVMVNILYKGVLIKMKVYEQTLA